MQHTSKLLIPVSLFFPHCIGLWLQLLLIYLMEMIIFTRGHSIAVIFMSAVLSNVWSLIFCYSVFFSYPFTLQLFLYWNFQEGVKYAVKLRNHGPRTLNGDGGMSKVKCSDGTTFTFTACSLSSNGTNHMRGQIPQILYYRWNTPLL